MLTRRFPDHTVTITVVRPASRDTFGNETPGPEFDVTDCLLAPSLGPGTVASVEQGGTAHTVVTGSQLFLPPGVDLRATDRVRIAGRLWEVEGDVGDWGDVGMQVAVRRVRG